jgi:hypothetical protein
MSRLQCVTDDSNGVELSYPAIDHRVERVIYLNIILHSCTVQRTTVVCMNSMACLASGTICAPLTWGATERTGMDLTYSASMHVNAYLRVDVDSLRN